MCCELSFGVCCMVFAICRVVMVAVCCVLFVVSSVGD